MKCRLGVVLSAVALSPSLLFSQLMTRSDSGFITPEYFQVTGAVTADRQIPMPLIGNLSAQDVNGDGKVDLLVSGFSEGGTTLLENQGNQNFKQIIGNSASYCNPAFETIGNGIGFCTLADLNGDRLPDKIFAYESADAVHGSQGEVDYPEIRVQLAIGPGSYAPAHKYVLGGKAEFISSVAAGDFNGDGRTDIAVLLEPQVGQGAADTIYGRVVILFGNADGTFSLSKSYSTSTWDEGFLPYQEPNSESISLVALDLNGDGKSDLIIYCGFVENFTGLPPYDPASIFYGTSDGLSAQRPIADSQFSVLLPANIQGEGLHDLVALEQDGYAHVLLWGGPGSSFDNYFKSDQQLQSTFYSAAIATGDFNRDGHTDIAVLNYRALDIFLQGAGGTFSAPRQYATNGDSEITTVIGPIAAMAIADFNGDGKLDIATGGNPLNIYYGDGQGSFTAPLVNLPSPAGPFVSYSDDAIVTADFNRDGHADIGATTSAPTSGGGVNWFVSVFLGSGNGSFHAQANYAIPTPNATHAILAVGDVNGDGIPDVVTVSSYNFEPGPDTSVLLGLPGGGFAPAVSYTLGALGKDVLLRDVNNDGKLDLITDAGVALGTGDGTFGSLIPLPISPYVIDQMAIGDFNSDGKVDLLVTQYGALDVLLGDGTGNFTVKQTIGPFCKPKSLCNLGTIAVGHLNNGKNLDFVAAFNTADNQSAIIPYFGNGDGTFAPGATAVISANNAIHAPVFISSVAIQDVNGDGINDVVVNGNVTVLLGKGSGRFTTPIFFPTDNQTEPLFRGMVFADFNGDGALDVAVGAAGGFEVVLNSGYKTWPKPLTWRTAPQ